MVHIFLLPLNQPPPPFQTELSTYSPPAKWCFYFSPAAKWGFYCSPALISGLKNLDSSSLELLASCAAVFVHFFYYLNFWPFGIEYPNHWGKRFIFLGNDGSEMPNMACSPSFSFFNVFWFHDLVLFHLIHLIFQRNAIKLPVNKDYIKFKNKTFALNSFLNKQTFQNFI